MVVLQSPLPKYSHLIKNGESHSYYNVELLRYNPNDPKNPYHILFIAKILADGFMQVFSLEEWEEEKCKGLNEYLWVSCALNYAMRIEPFVQKKDR